MYANKEFAGILRPDGRKGIRNAVLVAYLVECAHHVSRRIVSAVGESDVQLIGFPGCYPNSYAFQMMEKLATHPNVGGVLLVSLGCEGFNRVGLAEAVAASGRPVETLVIQETGGTRTTIAAGIEAVERIRTAIADPIARLIWQVASAHRWRRRRPHRFAAGRRLVLLHRHIDHGRSNQSLTQHDLPVQRTFGKFGFSISVLRAGSRQRETIAHVAKAGVGTTSTPRCITIGTDVHKLKGMTCLMARDADPAVEDDDRRYRAPALEKGLDILELLARESSPLSIMAISQRLGRSKSELFRMVQVLEFRGFIKQSSTGDGFVATDKLFSLGLDQAPTKSLLEIALPRMKALSSHVGQSCHLAVRAGGDMVVVARVESAEMLGFTVRIGYRNSLARTCSGGVLFAFQDEDVRERWVAGLSADVMPEEIAKLRSETAEIRKQGFSRKQSRFVDGITDISAPVLRGHTAAAALTVPFVKSSQLAKPIDDVVRQLRAAAAEISAALLMFDHRV